MNNANPNYVNTEHELNVITRNGMFQLKGDKAWRIHQDAGTGEYRIGEQVDKSEVWKGCFDHFGSQGAVIPIIHKRELNS